MIHLYGLGVFDRVVSSQEQRSWEYILDLNALYFSTNTETKTVHSEKILSLKIGTSGQKNLRKRNRCGNV